MSIEIPSRLRKHLRKDDSWYSCVTSLKAKVEKFLSVTPEFFPDYTVHGIGHINEVLSTADKLILDDAFSDNDGVEKEADSGILEPSDIGYLVCAILIHDLGMFLRQDGVREITTGSRSCDRIKEFGDVQWKDVWKEYADRTKRFSSENMRYYFGKVMVISESCVRKETLDDDDKRVIGEFLRQNHGRLAHEIAINGLPGSEDIDLFANTDLTDNDRNMIGLLARSHTINIRDTEDYLESEFEEGPMPKNTPVFFLMAVLRIADYLDAGEHRAPILLEENQNISVPISTEEWAWNQCIEHKYCKWNLKTKSRHIYAAPKSSIEYVQLDKWFRSVQAELNLCWAILAEQYPNGYRLSIHRLTSRIYQTEVRKKMNEKFLTEEVKVTANPEITQLMITPLYGNNPTYGVRELLQNAVDACLERKDKDPAHKGLVTVRIDPWEDPETGKNLGVFTIEDNGIGMNAHVLMNYYLAAGASYRSSEEWKLDYTEDGHSRIARTGQFGVGFLASFLLGDTVSVTTRHRKDKKGYTFTFTNQAKPLNITRGEREDPGTTIRITLKPGVWKKLNDEGDYPWYNWYAFDDPEVQYFWDGKPVKYRDVSLSRDPANNPEWFPLESETFESYLWHPRPQAGRHFGRRPAFYCNGIRVYDTRNDPTLEDFGLKVPRPHISLMDPNAKLDINLARSEIQTFPEEVRLFRQVFRYHIARLLMTRWETEDDYRNNLTLVFPLRPYKRYGRIPFLLTAGAFTLNYPSVLSVMDIDQYVILYYDGAHAVDAIHAAYQFLPSHMPVSIAVPNDGPPSPLIEKQYMLDEYYFHSPSNFAVTLLSNNRGLWDSTAVNVNE